MTRIGRYYDWLGRFQRIARWVSRSGDETLTIHRRLDPGSSGVAPQHVVHERLLSAIGPVSRPRVIDAGCGLGGTIFHLHSRVGGSYDGVTLSAMQRERAEREARRLGVSDACRFHLRSYDDDLTDLAPDGADLVVAIESLAHSDDPARTIANLARFIRPGGYLAVADDVPADALADDDPDLVGFRAGWDAACVARAETFDRAFREAGLRRVHEEDLTDRVLLRQAGARERRGRMSGTLVRLARGTAAEQLVGALHGGMLLERLYARGLMRYILMVARRGGR